MKIETASPEMSDVVGANAAIVTVTKVPCGVCYTTQFFTDARCVELLRQDQHVVVDRASFAIEAAVNLPT